MNGRWQRLVDWAFESGYIIPLWGLVCFGLGFVIGVTVP